MAFEVICLESKALYALCENVAEVLMEKFQIKRKWINEKAAMDMLGIKSKTTLQNLRDKEEIVISKTSPKLILYDAESIEAYLDRHASGWVSEKDAVRMLKIKSSTDIRQLVKLSKIESKENGPHVFIYSIRSINNYLDSIK